MEGCSATSPTDKPWRRAVAGDADTPKVGGDEMAPSTGGVVGWVGGCEALPCGTPNLGSGTGHGGGKSHLRVGAELPFVLMEQSGG